MREVVHGLLRSAGLLGRHRLLALVVGTAVVLGAVVPVASYQAFPGLSGSLELASQSPVPSASSPASQGSVAPQATPGSTLPTRAAPGQPEWPRYVPSNEEKAAALAAQTDYRMRGYDYRTGFQQYSPSGDFLNYGAQIRFRDIPGIIALDHDGIPMVWYEDAYYYNPVTVAEHALSLYGRYTRGENTLSAFRTAVDRLVSLQDESGAFRYTFQYKYIDTVLEPGWTSGLAQGYALSVFARAVVSLGDRRYVDAGDRALEFLTTPVASGGVMDTMASLHGSLGSFVFFQEIVNSPPSYILNGFMFALLGLYDWSQLGGAKESARSYFQRGVLTLSNILQYYDLGAYSAYDLQHITYGRAPHVAGEYHQIHIYQLHALASITNAPELSATELAWRGYVD
jgi:hypothetical protein